MYEFLKIFERCGRGGAQCAELVRVGRFKEALWSQTRLDGTDPVAEFETFWLGWYGQFQAALEGRVKSAQARSPDINAHQRELEGWAYADWARCVADANRFGSIKAALNSNGWSYQTVVTEPAEDEIQKWAQALSRNTERQMYRFGRAETAWKEGLQQADERQQRYFFDKAQRLFITAFLGDDPDGQREGLEAALEKPIDGNRQSTLNQIRRSVLEEYRDQLKKGAKIETWKELADAVALHE
jgi:hypothetical protein